MRGDAATPTQVGSGKKSRDERDIEVLLGLYAGQAQEDTCPDGMDYHV